MTLPIFNPSWTPSVGLQNKPEVKILKADFGDGYTQSTRDGLNNIRAVYDLTWSALPDEDANDIIGFLEAQGGTDPFSYSIPGTRLSGNWTCETWTDQNISGGFRAITATFRQDFNLVT